MNVIDNSSLVFSWKFKHAISLLNIAHILQHQANYLNESNAMPERSRLNQKTQTVHAFNFSCSGKLPERCGWLPEHVGLKFLPEQFW